MTIGLEVALKLQQAAFDHARTLGLKPLTVAVLDPGGHLVSLARQDGASTLRPQVAIAKAAGALALGVPSRKIAEMAAERPQFVASLGPISPHGIVPAAGGVRIRDAAGTLLGAIGASGDTSDRDEACVLHALASMGLSEAD